MKKSCSHCGMPWVRGGNTCPLNCMVKKCQGCHKSILHIGDRPVIWVLGGPGVGKTTICKQLANTIGYANISYPELIIAESKRPNSKRLSCLAKLKCKDQEPPQDFVLQLIKEAVERISTKTKGFIIDGYPREKREAFWFEKYIAPCSAVVILEASRDTLQKRSMERNGPKDDIYSVSKRLNDYFEIKESVWADYHKKIVRINAEEPVGAVFELVGIFLKPLLEGGHIIPRLASKPFF